MQISNELHIPMFNHQLSDLIGQHSAINLMGNLTDDQSLIGDGETVSEMISNQDPKLIKDQFDRPSNVHGKTGHYNYYNIKLSLESCNPELTSACRVRKLVTMNIISVTVRSSNN